MRNTLEARLGLFFALALAVAVLILEMVGAFDFLRPGIRIFADFKDIQELKKGDSVKIKEGPLESFDGVVDETIPAKGIVRVIVTIFGRATPVELEYWQVEPV